MTDDPSIPEHAIEVFDRELAESAGLHGFACTVDGEIVGYRVRDEHGRLVQEHGLKDGRYHGYWREWDQDGSVTFETFYVDGLEHGTARQWSGGKLIGTYTLNYGTGVDLWRYPNGALAEERHLKDGHRHGFERWWRGDNRTVWEETHFNWSKEHGISRQWNARGRLRRGYPRYHIESRRVTKRQYLRASANDPSLPSFQSEDNEPFRTLPLSIQGDETR